MLNVVLEPIKVFVSLETVGDCALVWLVHDVVHFRIARVGTVSMRHVVLEAAWVLVRLVTCWVPELLQAIPV